MMLISDWNIRGLRIILIENLFKICKLSEKEKDNILNNIVYIITPVWVMNKIASVKLYYKKVVITVQEETIEVPKDSIIRFNIKDYTFNTGQKYDGLKYLRDCKEYFCDLVYKINETQYTLIRFRFSGEGTSNDENYHLKQVFSIYDWCDLNKIKREELSFYKTNPFTLNINGLQYIDTMSQYKKGCYVATCVYGSYDCKEVWSLRRYRDNYLDSFLLGRLFIKLYYKVSPKLVELFGDKEWFRKPIKKILDRKVKKLKNKGYEDTPYSDKY